MQSLKIILQSMISAILPVANAFVAKRDLKQPKEPCTRAL
jgi:hypothetical protein